MGRDMEAARLPGRLFSFILGGTVLGPLGMAESIGLGPPPPCCEEPPGGWEWGCKARELGWGPGGPGGGGTPPVPFACCDEGTGLGGWLANPATGLPRDPGPDSPLGPELGVGGPPGPAPGRGGGAPPTIRGARGLVTRH
eukprot:CAMPEP_0117766828 /NCGR_PEP_ID=MMETSP0947-20121206/21178_1 /TAXON_ID=44440 /ORGANISM="Chattonella subsalsa, Strain CCMP2191" /LENGTH=139 /DNA_ID=CAMNT_0005590225 /DNA_START=404 /DNA_END=823 /DNA_ORIENTATION=+